MEKYNKEEMKEFLSQKMVFLKNLDFNRLSKYNRGYLRYRVDPLKSFVFSEFSTYHKIFSLYDSSKCLIIFITFCDLVPTALRLFSFCGHLFKRLFVLFYQKF